MNETCSDALFDFRSGIEQAPVGRHAFAAQLNHVIAEVSEQFAAAVRELGLRTERCDRLWEVESCLYDFVRQSNPDHPALTAAEHFGRAMNDPRRRDAPSATSNGAETCATCDAS